VLIVKWLNGIALHRKSISELRSVTCHVGSHSVTYHLTQVNVPHLTPRGMEGWVDLGVGYIPRWFTWPGVKPM